jgi:IS30 family transposase
MRRLPFFNKETRAKTNYPILAGEAFEKIGIDLVGPLEKTESGNSYIVVAVDYLTKYVMMEAIPGKCATTIGKFIFEKIILEHGFPNMILSDNGREFKNTLITDLCNIMHINKKFSSPYRPQTNGLVERTNQTLM